MGFGLQRVRRVHVGDVGDFVRAFIESEVRNERGVAVRRVGRGSDDSLFALVDGKVKFERYGRDRKKVSVYAVEQ